MLMSSREFLRCFELSSTAKNYRASMDKRRPGSALSQNRFGWYLRHRCMVYASQKGSAIVGQWRNETLMVSHFAPVGQRDGVELLKKLAADKSVKALFAVTEDMVGMLERLGFKNLQHTENMDFRGQIVLKHIFSN